ncbi:hypothetical protein K435DRAFT_970985 [Dendrothele bispora CBS 962.96]|uniref:P-loop containing nucleoside triphosphate hydrolase protein n=1 Tax=Dendrothele bispora (strain CBS 962.96) TaxID=1314807 RepID=A0A4S8L8H5_DENBC|nr:hypothetical protein K435DRAFT_970985 [Dendrothele bispora CBS 962.96]
MAMMDTISVDMDHDELDIMAIPIQTAPILPSPSPITTSITVSTSHEVRRSSRDKSTRVLEHTQPKQRKRKRSMNMKGLETKKLKMDEKKANTQIAHGQKSERDLRRNLWLLRHRAIFQCLAPNSTRFFDNIQDNGQEALSYTPFHELEEQPKLINNSTGMMKDYQLYGLSYLVYMYKNGMNCILGDEMGLGKTLQTLSLFAYIAETQKGLVDPHLVICPLSVLSSWESEAARWLPSMKTVRFHGSESERKRLRTTLKNAKYDILVTTYEVYMREDSWFKSRRWTYVVLDEGHKIKNAGTQVSQSVQYLGAMYRLVLTGTPVQNNLVELWGLVHFLFPYIFTPETERRFLESFDMTRGTYASDFLNAAEQLLSVIMLRRTKANVDIDVPPRVEQTVFIPLTEMQRYWTYQILTGLDKVNLENIFNPAIEFQEAAANEGRQEAMKLLEIQMNNQKGNAQYNKLMSLLMKLRQICDHPYIVRGVEPDPYHIGEHVVAASSKLITIDKILADVLPKGEKVLIFSQWSKMLDMLEDMMHLRSIEYARLDGTTSRPRRTLDIKLFQHEKSTIQVYLISTRAGGLGINLTKASTVIMADSDWNPQNDLQAIARAHRIGQTKTVHVYRLICGGSVEDQMLDRIRRKLFLSVKLMGSDSAASSEDAGIKSSELLDILRKGSSVLVGSSDNLDLQTFIDAPISTILETSKSREQARDAKLKNDMNETNVDEDSERLLRDAQEEEKRLLSGVAQVKCRFFDGKYFERKREGDIPEEWKQLDKRVRHNNLRMIDGLNYIVDGPIEVIRHPEPTPKKPKKTKEWEDYCLHCRDGGELYLCNFCPRVFHHQCRDLSKAEASKSIGTCSQHACCVCSRGTGDAGGLLFRCRTCPNAFCEDCLPEPFEPIGDILPEFSILHHGQQDSAYYIYCSECMAERDSNSAWWRGWQKELAKAEKGLAKLKLHVN